MDILARPHPQLAPLASRLRLLAAFTEQPPASARLPLPYQAVPVGLRDLIAKGIGRFNRRRLETRPGFPLWPLDLSADLLSDLAGLHNPLAQGPAPVILTHDLDTPEGLDNLLRLFLPVEERLGARSVNFLPPKAWPLDLAQLDEVAARGHALGIHGFDHNNRTPFCLPEERKKRLDAAASLVERYGIRGYRAPSLLRSQALLRDLSSRYFFDSSIPSSGGLFPVPGNGCASARPFLAEGILELPISLPRDANLWFLGYSAQEILAVWKQCALRIAASGGVVVLLTHCEARFSGKSPLWETSLRFLEFLAECDQFRFSTPAEVFALADGPAPCGRVDA
ncbi:MAG: hypothetical protein A2051_07765 [Desulfovibrionales bacterium GWA2_65_9]|nr:MAG: hypothetical protein A2051_07765 [Desulfovibrionales bacterium GWA2_65_9]